MPVFHTDIVETNTSTPSALQRLHDALTKLWSRREALEDFEGFEREVHALFAEAEREVLAEGLERLDVDLPLVVIEGQVHHRVLRSPETYTTAVGSVTVTRTLYRTDKDAQAVVPLELRAGIVAGHWTALAARQATFLVAHLTPQETENVLRELGNMTPSKSGLDRLPKRLSERWEEKREGFEAALRAPIARVPSEALTLAVSLDGVMVPMKDGQRDEKRAQGRREGKKTRGPAGYQEVGCATLSFYDAQGERLETVRLARMPEPKKATLKSMLSAEVEAVLRQRPELQVVKLADGAEDNWRYFSTALPGGVELVDFFHAAEHLQAAFATAYGENSSRTQAQSAKYRHLLLEETDGVETVIRALRYLRDKHPRRTRIGQVLGYFRRHRHRMRYAEAQAQNLPVGSGVVEAACKTLATQRMKRSGMRWRHDGGQAILTFRALVQSERFKQAWPLLSGTYRTEVSAPENVVAFPRRRLH